MAQSCPRAAAELCAPRFSGIAPAAVLRIDWRGQGWKQEACQEAIEIIRWEMAAWVGVAGKEVMHGWILALI